MAALRASALSQLANRPVRRVLNLASSDPEAAALVEPPDHPPADVVVVELEGARVVVRPSGTEPKLKAYFEVVLPVGRGDDLTVLRVDARRSLATLRADLALVLGLT